MPKAKLTDKEITTAIAKLPEWKVVGGKLNRAFKFDSFVDAFTFMTKVAFAADKMEHHPEFFNVYNRVVINLATHDVDGISNLDIELAEKINAI
ncbi:4a-hydroxytetrahydrobiopterin dehydratase [Pseudanabaena yagii]|uniref:Putative pterin-4-alpha-carbinolamine dehydratase n=1 Tax=Pseudanabaena yagii GIHE-NHR1 TaxID=2722753 RepID=A0ABX1LVM7_9CYAN|nr:4a-hydroxytetrahydrobiopterin dehydratase [Pseudanabaena yagii]NMF60230.1 4a-hydroxytetrahydrobiopterin dehydratase [Pseudanabaena yagii GIHE-NHR1]